MLKHDKKMLVYLCRLENYTNTIISIILSLHSPVTCYGLPYGRTSIYHV